MTSLGERVATSWVDALTRTAPEQEAADRRAEIRSDVHEQLAVDAAAGLSGRRTAWAVAGRVLRGVPADLWWRAGLEAAPARLRWHLRNPGTVATALLVVTLPLNLLADSVPERLPGLRPLYATLWGLTFIVAWILLGLAAAALAARLVPGFLEGVPRVVGLSAFAHARRGVLTVSAVCLAVSAVSRLSGDRVFQLLSTAGWMGFGLSVVAYVVLVLVSVLTRVLPIGRYLPKV